MAANSYYNANIPMTHEQQEHLLAYSTPSGSHQSSPSFPLKPLHLVVQTNHHNGHGSFEKHDVLQHAQKQDKV